MGRSTGEGETSVLSQQETEETNTQPGSRGEKKSGHRRTPHSRSDPTTQDLDLPPNLDLVWINSRHYPPRTPSPKFSV